MKRYLILTETVTYAIKGRDILRKNGMTAQVEKLNYGKSGCSYAVTVSGDIGKAEALLKASGIKILEIRPKR